MSFWDILRPTPIAKGKAAPPPATPDALRAALAQAQAEAAATEQAAAEAATNRAAQLLVADDAELDELDRRLAFSQRQADRAAAAVAALEERLTAAEQTERQAELDRIHERGAEARQRGVALYAKFETQARELAEVVTHIKEAAEVVAVTDKSLRDRGDPRAGGGDLDFELRPRVSAQEGLRSPIWAQTRLPSGIAPFDFNWPPHVETRIPFAASPPPGEGAEPAPPPSRLFVS